MSVELKTVQQFREYLDVLFLSIYRVFETKNRYSLPSNTLFTPLILTEIGAIDIFLKKINTKTAVWV